MDSILEAAFHYYTQGFPVLPVTKNKTPYIEWKTNRDRWREEGQTEDDIKFLFDVPEVPRYGVALLTWPYSPIVCLDFDGPHAIDCWKQTDIALPETAINYSASGFPHLLFRIPSAGVDGLKRSVRIVQEDGACGWKGKRCGVDLLVNGYIVVPPTPGYREDADHPFGSFAELPAAVLELVRKTNGRVRQDPGDGNLNWVSKALTGPVHEGQRNEVGVRLAGYYLNKGIAPNDVITLMVQWGKTVCRPPLNAEEIGKLTDAVERFAAQQPREVTQDAAIGPEFQDLTQLWSAGRFVSDHRDGVLWCQRQRSWYIWTGKVWCADDVRAVHVKAKDTITRLMREAVEIKDHKKQAAYLQFAMRLQRRDQMDAMLDLAKPYLPARVSDFDRDPMLFSCANGTLDLRTGTLREHRREDMMTKLAPVAFVPDARCDLFLAFLDRIMAEDQGVVRFLQKILGYALTADVREDLFFIFWGRGANGKTTLLRLLLWLLGDYAKVAAADLFIVKKHETHATDYADLWEARFVTVLETGEGQRLNTGKIKVHTGRDPVKARFLYQDNFTFAPTYKVVFCTNHRPVVRETGTALWRRLVLFPFVVEIPKAEQDKKLGEKLKAEAPGILRWLVEGCLLWQQEGLESPEAVKAATENYQAESDPLRRFLAERCVISPHASVKKDALRAAFVLWSEQEGDKYQMNVRTFAEQLREKGIGEGACRGERTWKGVGLALQE